VKCSTRDFIVASHELIFSHAFMKRSFSIGGSFGSSTLVSSAFSTTGSAGFGSALGFG
jgi:hypothetical protein